LNDIPDWVLGVVFVGGTVVVTLVALALAIRLLPAWRSERSNQVVAGVAAMVMTMFALLLAFVIVNLYNSYDSAVNNVAAEATSLTELVQDVHGFPPAARRRIERAVAEYVAEVRDHEFRQLRAGHSDPRAQLLIAGMFAALESFSPVTTAQQAFYDSAASQLHSIIDQRESRLDAAETSIPGPLLGLMLLLAVLTLGMSLFIQVHYTPLDVAIVVTLAIVISAGLLTAEILQYPFSGSIAVNSEPFHSGALGQLVQTYL
jgi:hypothetical protein